MTDLEGTLPDEYDEIFEDLRTVLLASPSEFVADQHLAAMADAQEVRVEPTPLAPRRRARVLAAAAVGAAVLVGGSIAAAAGELPGSIQDAVASVFEPFGVDIPRSGAEPSSTPAEDADQGSTTGIETSDASVPTTAAPSGSGGNGESSVDPADSNGDLATPGNSPSSPPGQSGSAPGQSGSTPGQPSDPGGSANAPGQTGESPGRSETAPGHSDNENNKPETPPGQVP